MTGNPLEVPELLQLILALVDAKTLHACACVSLGWFRLAASISQSRLQDQKVWMKDAHPRSSRSNFSTIPLDKLDVKGEEQEVWEISRWWLRLHSDIERFIDQKAALQFVYVHSNREFGTVAFRDRERPFFNTPTGQDCFPTHVKPTILSLNWQMFWWEDFDELLRSCELFEGIFGYSGSIEPFSRNEIAQIICMNAAWYLFTFYERAVLMVMLLTDGRFAYLCEGSYAASLDSHVTIRYKIFFASSLQMLLFFGLGDTQRVQLGIDIEGDSKSSPSKLLGWYTQMSKRFRDSENPDATLDHPFLSYPTRRLRVLFDKLKISKIDLYYKLPEEASEYQLGRLPISDQETQVLWAEDRGEDDRFLQEWERVWKSSGSYSTPLGWLNEEESIAQMRQYF